jgi:hypothetical protein
MMSSDEFLERVDKAAQNWTGESRGPGQIEADFPLYGHAKRAEALDQLDEHLRNLTVEGETSLRDYTRLTSLRRNLGRAHSTLIKVGR